MKEITFIVLSMFFVQQSAAQQTNEFSLNEAYQLIKTKYPTVEKIDIQRKIADFNMGIYQSGLYPDVSMSASASYQSDVTEVPFAAPGTAAPTFSKDHYNVSIDVSQPLFDGGKVNALKSIERSKELAEIANVGVELQKIRAQVDQLFFGIQLLKKKRSSLELLTQDIENQLKLVKSRVANGALLPGNELALKAELLKVKQQQLETNRSVSSGYRILGEITGKDLSSEPELIVKEILTVNGTGESERAEYELLNSRKEMLENQKKLYKTNKLPVLSAFAKTAYSRPGLNAFDDDLQLFWVVGLSARWNFRSWRNSGKQIEILNLQQNNLSAEKDAFTRQLNSLLIEAENRIEVLKEQIALDKQVLELREKVVLEQKKLLDGGVITSTEWLIELNEEHRARLNLEIHQVQLIQAYIEYQTKKGMSWN